MIKISIKTLKGDLFQIEAELEETVEVVKSKIQQVYSDFAVEKQKLIHAGKVLKDTLTVSEIGLKPNDFIVCMVSKDPVASKPKPPQAAQPPPAVVDSNSVPASTSVSTPSQSTTIASTPAAPVAPSTENPEALNALVSMGFPENESRSALRAAMGNPDLAYEFLLTGIPPQLANQNAPIPAPAVLASAQSPPADTGNNISSREPASFQRLRANPQFNALKQMVQSNPSSLPQILNVIGQQDSQLLQDVHANNEAFITMMNEPITNTTPAAPVASSNLASLPNLGGSDGPSPAQISALLQSLPPDQRAAFAQSVGMTPDQLQMFMQMISSLPPEQLQQMLPSFGGAGGATAGAPPGANIIRLTEEEMQAVNRLMQLGFTQQQAVQAYLACDKDETVAANFLFENGGMFEDDEFGGGEGGGGFQDDGDDDMYH